MGYHAGEIEVQERAGVRAAAQRVEKIIHEAIPLAATAFLQQRRVVAIGTADRAGRPWASLLFGAPGFACVSGERTVRLAASPSAGDPLRDNLKVSPFIGMTAVDFATRRRFRLNGRLEVDAEGTILIHTDQVYANCPKYIQRREAIAERVHVDPLQVHRAGSLTEAQRAWIRRADTFFIATVNPGEGADVSHRGGLPGFIRVEGSQLTWPDYTGNAMFNTLGNIAVHGRAGLAFPDFESGDLLQLTGRAWIDWDEAHAGAVPGAERLVGLDVDEVVEIPGAFPERFRLIDYSPFNPAPWDSSTEQT